MGNTEPGDRVKYCGRGLVRPGGQPPKAGAKIGVDLVNHPDRAMVPANAAGDHARGHG